MNANVGMSYAVAAAVDTYTPGSAITYETGFVVGEARGANVTWNAEDSEFYGDDVLLDSDVSPTGYSIEIETAGLALSVREKLLGEVKGSSDEYKITGGNPPDVGFGYVKTMRDNSSGTVVTSYEGWWYYKCKFGQPNEEARTKEKSMEWRTPTITGKGAGIFQAAAQEAPDFAEHKKFATLALAKAYINGKAGIT